MSILSATIIKQSFGLIREFLYFSCYLFSAFENPSKLLLSFFFIGFGFFKGLEDHLGDMDFKIAGTRKGVTAVQLDIKPAGIPLDIICECLEPALKGRLQILARMDQEISAPRTQDHRNSPQLGWFFNILYACFLSLCWLYSFSTCSKLFIHDAATLKFSNDALRRLIGPLGVLKRKIEEDTGSIQTWQCYVWHYINYYSSIQLIGSFGTELWFDY